ncbi:type IV secretory system conjugative DNA transfer family protein [Streptomyces sp. SPB074]|uniref:type IV secretory system conjugative DNA transfer family protein n=1 Tax=Streptomyces sp. (strain SPB074) TaxID=465543 RepID=UPI00017F1EC5|nr:type IV secretory system conjugative DNA transfer family protein [Streptomyces sp. SPB074]
MSPRKSATPGRPGGVPDGVLLGVLVLALGLTLLLWLASGLAALFAHGTWPTAISLRNTPLALRSLLTDPKDLHAAWPDAPASALAGYGLFWGLFFGLAMVLVVLALFVLSSFARHRALRAARKNAPPRTATPDPGLLPGEESVRIREEALRRREAALRREEEELTRREEEALSRREKALEARRETLDLTKQTPRTPPAEHAAPAVPSPRRSPVLLGDARTRLAEAIEAVQEAAGPVLVVTSQPALWQETKDARAKLGPVLVHDPLLRCDTPDRLHWSPTAGCVDARTATVRARALLAPVRPVSRLDMATADTAETLLRCFLHAADTDGRPVSHVHRWAQGSRVHEAVTILRTHPTAAPGLGGELEAALTAYPERRDMAQQLTARALAGLSEIHLRESCASRRADTARLDSFLAEEGTLYLVGVSTEDPKAPTGAQPFTTALASDVVEHGRREAARSPAGRLDPPLTLVLEDVAAVAPLPDLPALLATGPAAGLRPLAFLRSQEQARSRWPDADLVG